MKKKQTYNVSVICTILDDEDAQIGVFSKILARYTSTNFGNNGYLKKLNSLKPKFKNTVVDTWKASRD